MGKPRYPHFFQVFVPFSAIFPCFCPVLPVLGASLCPESGPTRCSAPLQLSPKRTLFFGAIAATIGVFHASTRGAASLKWRVSTSANFGSRAVSAGSVVLRPHCRHRTRSIAG